LAIQATKKCWIIIGNKGSKEFGISSGNTTKRQYRLLKHVEKELAIQAAKEC